MRLSLRLVGMRQSCVPAQPQQESSGFWQGIWRQNTTKTVNIYRRFNLVSFRCRALLSYVCGDEVSKTPFLQNCRVTHDFLYALKCLCSHQPFAAVLLVVGSTNKRNAGCDRHAAPSPRVAPKREVRSYCTISGAELVCIVQFVQRSRKGQQVEN